MKPDAFGRDRPIEMRLCGYKTRLRGFRRLAPPQWVWASQADPESQRQNLPILCAAGDPPQPAKAGFAGTEPHFNGAADGAADGPGDDDTGLPGLRTWRAVYLLVVGVFILYVVLMVVLSRVFA